MERLLDLFLELDEDPDLFRCPCSASVGDGVLLFLSRFVEPDTDIDSIDDRFDSESEDLDRCSFFGEDVSTKPCLF